MITDWKQEIAIGWLVKQGMMEVDTKKIFPYYLPELAATDEQIIEAEKHLGYALDSRYREFLKCSNGWHGFWHSADLFGTGDLIAGPRHDNAEFILSFLDDDFLRSRELQRQHLLPISATSLDRDVLVITCPASPLPGQVVWFAGQEIERFNSFDDYFLAMIEYGRQDIKWLKERQKSDGNQ